MLLQQNAPLFFPPGLVFSPSAIAPGIAKPLALNAPPPGGGGENKTAFKLNLRKGRQQPHVRWPL